MMNDMGLRIRHSVLRDEGSTTCEARGTKVFIHGLHMDRVLYVRRAVPCSVFQNFSRIYPIEEFKS